MWQLPPPAASSVPQFPPSPETWGWLGVGSGSGGWIRGWGRGWWPNPTPAGPCPDRGAGSALDARSHLGTRGRAAPMTGIPQIPAFPSSHGGCQTPLPQHHHPPIPRVQITSPQIHTGWSGTLPRPHGALPARQQSSGGLGDAGLHPGVPGDAGGTPGAVSAAVPRGRSWQV